jgi:molybdate transport repressor ModE-like protein
VIDPRHLRVLREVARTGTFSAAARSLGYTQPAISQQVRALERRVGTPVVTRAGGGMRLTSAGEVLVRHASGILGGLAAAEEEVAAVAGLRAGRVRLAAFPSGSATLVPAAVAQLSRAHPGVEVSLVELEPPASVELLRSGECDLALTFDYASPAAGSGEPGAPVPAPDEEGLWRTALLEDVLEAVLPPEHPLADAAELGLADLAGEAWIAGCPRCRGHLVNACTVAGFSPRITFATDDYVAVQSLVAAGLGVALVPDLVLSAARHPQVAVRRLRPAPRREVAVVTTPELRRVPAVRAFVDVIRTVAADVRAS